MQVNYSEYNQVHLPRADHLISFVKNLEHAMQKTNDYEGAMHQLRCIGFTEEFIKEMSAVASDYKKYHKQRIYSEQTAHALEVQYPNIQKDRLEQYAKNRELIQAILAHDDYHLLIEQIEEAVNGETDTFRAATFLNHYLDGDVDRMVMDITGWNMEDLLAKAKIIPDEKEYFYKPGDLPLSDIAFPLYGKKTLTIEEFKDYLIRVRGIHDDTWRMIQSVINFAKFSCNDTEQQIAILVAVLKDYGIPEEIVRMVAL